MTTLKKSLAILGKAGALYYDALYHLLPMGMVTLLACLVILPGPPALAGLWEIVRRLARAEAITWRDYGHALKTYALQAWGLCGLILLLTALLAGNLWFYTAPISPIPADIGRWITAVWMGVGLVWVGTLFYAGTFLVALESPRIWIALRSSLFLTLLHPLPTLIWVLSSGVLLAVSFYLPILLAATPALIALISALGMRQLTEPIFNAAETAIEIEE